MLYEIRLEPTGELGVLEVSGESAIGGGSQVARFRIPRLTVSEASFVAAAALLAERLRQSYWVRHVEWRMVRQALDALPDDLRAHPLVQDTLLMVGAAERLLGPAVGPRPVDFDRVPLVKR